MKKNTVFEAARRVVRMAALLLTFSVVACGRGYGDTKLTEKDFKYDMTKDGSGVKLLSYISDKGGKLVIPATIEGKPVVAIGDIDENNPFLGFKEMTEAKKQDLARDKDQKRKDQSKLAAVGLSYLATNSIATKDRKDRITGITIPDTVTYIGTDAFNGCEGLKSITWPKSLKYIGKVAFERSGLTSVTIPAGIIIDIEAFARCKSLATVTIGENVEVDRLAFSGCAELATVNLPSKLTYTDKSYIKNEEKVGGKTVPPN